MDLLTFTPDISMEFQPCEVKPWAPLLRVGRGFPATLVALPDTRKTT